MFPVSRRIVLTGLLAAPLMSKVGHAVSDIDVAIVGAGTAGIAAGQVLRAAGLKAVIFEARDRIGGRTSTDVATFGRPFDLGAHWLHVAESNPLVPIAKSQGHMLAESSTDDASLFTSGRRRPMDVSASVAEAAGRIERRSLMPVLLGNDRPLSDVVDEGDRWERIAGRLAAVEMAAEPGEISLVDYAELGSGADLVVDGGLGAFVAAQSRGLDVRLSAPVAAIRWGEAGRVELEGSFGTVCAAACLVTVPTSLLAKGTIRFTPELPVAKREAIDALPLGLMNKIAMLLDAPLPDMAEYAVELDMLEAGRSHVLHFSADRRLATVLVTGDFAKTLEAEGEAAARAFGVEVLRGVAGARPRIVATATTGWGRDPLALGSYSHCRVGSAGARKVYEQALADRLFFAGEAASGKLAVTVGGAWSSGVAAAERIVAMLAR